MPFRLVIESELFEDNKVSNRVLSCLNLLEGGTQCCLLLYFLICMNHNNIVDLVHVGFIHIFLPQFMADGLANVLVFEVGHLCVSLGTFEDCVRGYCFHIWVEEGRRFLGHDGWMADIAVVCPKIPIQSLYCTEKLVQGYWTNIEDVAL